MCAKRACSTAIAVSAAATATELYCEFEQFTVLVHLKFKRAAVCVLFFTSE